MNKNIIGVFSALCIVLFMFGCKDDSPTAPDPQIDNNIVGTWMAIEMTYDEGGIDSTIDDTHPDFPEYTLKLNSDGSYEETDFLGTFTGTWTAANQVINLDGFELASYYLEQGDLIFENDDWYGFDLAEVVLEKQ